MSSSTKLTGVHGVGLDGVCHQEQRQDHRALVERSNNFKASVGLLVVVTVQNQGTAPEANVPVKVT